MSLYDVLSQNTINTLVCKMIGYIRLNSEIDLLNDISNEYCSLTLDLGDNVVAGDEVILEDDFKITLTDKIFNELNYYLTISYYELNPDIDERYNDILKTKTIELSTGENTIIIDDYPVYLQPSAILEVRV